MDKLVTLSVDGIQVAVPEKTLVVDAAKKVGVHIPVFCYHPKLEPVGMCRMCLVEIGRPVRNRETGEFERETDGSLKVMFGAKLETACTVPVSEGMVVRGFSESVRRSRQDILEFLLTSHPLDCPVCDKGGECPLQNLTIAHGPGTSRFIFDEKKHLSKEVPLGELIILDRERCIQCGRCVRFQKDIVDDPVIDFSERGRSFQIITNSEPGFNSYFSGNTTDICPVGALMTVDFRFGARPWEMKSAASICQQCSVGCNLTFNIRRENLSGGDVVIKRVMPRQNEWVNEIWLCDKGRFGYHYVQSKERLTQPLVKENGKLVPTSWDDALQRVSTHIKSNGTGLLTLVSGRLANEDLFNLRQLSEFVGGRTALYTHMAGGEFTSKVGVSTGTNLSSLGEDTTFLVIASDLEEEAPLYWLRVKQATEKGARLLVFNARPTKLDKYATQIVRYPYGSEIAVVQALTSLATGGLRTPIKRDITGIVDEIKLAARILSESQNCLIMFGSEGLGLSQTQNIAEECANLLVEIGHFGKPNNGLIGVWQQANSQGAWDLGIRPIFDLPSAIKKTELLYIIAADPVGDDAVLAEAIKSVGFLVVQDLALTETAQRADVVLPAQPFTEREGTCTSAERRVQRFYQALPARPGTRPDFAIAAQIGGQVGFQLESQHPWRVMSQIANLIPAFSEVNYQRLSQTETQLPIIDRTNFYYGGTAYENTQGLGVHLLPVNGVATPTQISEPSLDPIASDISSLMAVPVTRLYDRGILLLPSTVLHHRIPVSHIIIHPEEASIVGVSEGEMVKVQFNNVEYQVVARFDEGVPRGIVLIPRSMGLPIHAPTPVGINPSLRVTG